VYGWAGVTGRIGTVLGLADDTSVIVRWIEGKLKLTSNSSSQLVTAADLANHRVMLLSSIGIFWFYWCPLMIGLIANGLQYYWMYVQRFWTFLLFVPSFENLLLKWYFDLSFMWFLERVSLLLDGVLQMLISIEALSLEEWTFLLSFGGLGRRTCTSIPTGTCNPAACYSRPIQKKPCILTALLWTIFCSEKMKRGVGGLEGTNEGIELSAWTCTEM